MTKLIEDAWECGYNFTGDCTNEDCGCYGLKCPFKFLEECPVHNYKVGEEC